MGQEPGWWRGVLTLALVMAVMVGAPTAYPGNWPPAVVVESSSMMHADGEVAFGRYGTIDPGDLVLVKRVASPEEVRTFVEDAEARYGSAGDVIVFRPGGDEARSPVIHRAMAYVDVAPEGFRVRWDPAAPCEGDARKDPADAAWCVFPAEGVLVPSAGIAWRGGRPWRPDADGFITKGDNAVTNAWMDPAGGISVNESGAPGVVRLEWVVGKARGELPWLGLEKLAAQGKPNEPDPPASYVRVGSAYAPADLWVSLAVALALVVGGPLAWDGWRAWRSRRRAAP